MTSKELLLTAYFSSHASVDSKATDQTTSTAGDFDVKISNMISCHH